MLSSPKSKHVLFYKLGKSLGGEKQVTAVPWVECSRRLGRRKRANALLKTYVYEAFASQGNFMTPYSCYTMISKPYYPPLKPIAEANRFIAANRDAAEGEQLADVALVFSYASHLQEFTFISNPYFKRVKEIADRLGSAHVLYDVIVFGDGEILPEFIGEPKKYPRLLVPECEVTRAQRKLIDSLGERAIFVKDLKELKIPSMLSTDAPKEVYFSLNKTPERTYLQLLNYDYDKRRDEMRPKSFEFSLKLPHEIERAGFRGESGKADLKVDGKNLKGNVKDLVHFGFVRMKNRYL